MGGSQPDVAARAADATMTGVADVRRSWTGTPSPPQDNRLPAAIFRHEAAMYAGISGFVERTSSFIRDSLAAAHPIMVMVTADKIALLRDELGADAGRVRFADMGVIGRNPARIIPAWHDFFSSTSSPEVRGIDEPIWAARTPDELIESQRHEMLLNVAFSGTRGSMLCPYDVTALPASVIDEAMSSHPIVSDQGRPMANARYSSGSPPIDQPLRPPRARPQQRIFGRRGLRGIRQFVSSRGGSFGITGRRNDELVLATNEVASNSLRHGGGGGAIRIWYEGDVLICEIRDSGRIVEPLIGRRRPDADAEGGFGLWLANQVCDLVQVRSFTGGTVVRLHMSRGPRT